KDGIRDDLVTGVQTCALPISVKRSRGVVETRPASGSKNVSLPLWPITGAPVLACQASQPTASGKSSAVSIARPVTASAGTTLRRDRKSVVEGKRGHDGEAVGT